ncbi:Gag-Pol polyprotein, partial [Stegodyphus mimosarum]
MMVGVRKCAARSSESSFIHDSKDESGHLLALEKVSSLLKVEEGDERMPETHHLPKYSQPFASRYMCHFKIDTQKLCLASHANFYKNSLKACEKCQRSNIHKHTKSPISTFLLPDARFSHIHIDFIDPLPISEGFQYCLTIIDRFTRWPEVIPSSNMSAETTCKALISIWIPRFGCPSTIITDQGRNFESHLCRELEFLNLEQWSSFGLVPILRNTVTDEKEQIDSKVEPNSLIPSIPSNEMQVNKICSDTNLYSTKPPPIPERTYRRIEGKNVCPPLPSRNARNVSEKVSTLCDQSRRELDKVVNKISIQQKCNISESGPDINRSQQSSESLECGEYAISNSFVENNLSHKTNKVSPDPNREFICPVHGDRCKSNMSINKVSNNQTSEFKMTVMKALHSPAQNHKNLASRYSSPENVCNETELQLHNKSDGLTVDEFPANPQCSTLVPESENQNLTKISESTPHSLDDYVNLEFKKPALPVTNKNFSGISSIHKSTFQLLSNPPCPVDTSYSNIQFGKPYCPTPNPVPATCEIAISSFSSSLKSEKLTKSDRSVSPSYTLNSTSNNASDDAKEQKIQQSPTCSVNYGTDCSKSSLITPKLKNIPNTLPAFRKQMSAPAASASLRPELPSPGRKSSCPVTASASMIKSPLPVNAMSSMRPMHLQSHGTVIGHLRVSTSRSPDHSSISSISSASDELSSNHSSPKVLSTFQNFGAVIRQNITADNQYENVVIPQKPSTSSRPSSVSSEKELNYASLDLTPATGDDAPRSPSIQKPSVVRDEESLMYAEIDFTKSEGLKNISGSSGMIVFGFKAYINKSWFHCFTSIIVQREMGCVLDR